MKKIGIFLITILLVLTESVHASEIVTFERTSENRYGIPERFNLGDKQIEHAMITPYVDSSKKVYDFAELFQEEENIKLEEYAQKISKQENYGIVIVTIPDLDSRTPREYADDFYDYNDFSKDGILLLISLGSRDVYISTSGYGQILFDNSRVDSMIEEITPDLSNQDYYDAVHLFLRETENYFDRGPSKSMSRCEIINSYGDYTCKKKVPVFWIIPISTLISLLVTWLCTKKYKKIMLADDADTYLMKEELELGKKVDTFLHTSTARIRISSNSSSGGGGSSHHGSSGASHGGGGGKF